MISHLFPRPNRPGIAPFIRRQVRELTERGVAVTVISPIPWVPPFVSRGVSDDMRESQAVPERWQIDGCDVFAPRFPKLPGRLDNGLFGPLFYMGVRRLAQALHRERHFDLVHGQMLVPDGFAAARLGQVLGIPSVATERGYLSVMAVSSRGQRAAIRWALREIDQSIFVSRSLKDLACSIGLPKRPPQVVYTGLDHDSFTRLPTAEARSRLGLASDDYVIVHVGRNDPRKGVEELMEAFTDVAHHLPAARLCLVGGGSLDRSLMARAKSKGVGDRVRITGVVPHGEVPIWLSAADLVAHPSRRNSEGLPNAVVEAAACGCPIITTRVSGIPEIVEHDVSALLVEPEDVPALVQGILALASDRPRAAQLGERARLSVRERFSWSKHADQMMAVYGSLGSRGVPAR
jgi:glycosyltransferase involved in cell wall biosynthesis